MSEQNTILSKMTEDYKSKLANGLSSYRLKTLEGVTVYWRQENMAQRSRYYAGLINRDIEAYVDVIIHRALTEKGQRMFLPEQREIILKQTDPNVIVEMANAILGSLKDDQPDTDKDKFEEATKN